MVYKRYIRKNGKLHGPYYYESYRVDGKIKKRYIGTELSHENKVVPHHHGLNSNLSRKLVLGIIGCALLVIALAVVIVFLQAPRQYLILDLEPTFAFNETLSGKALVTIEPGDYIPADTAVRITLSRGENVLVSETENFEQILEGQAEATLIEDVKEVCEDISNDSLQNVCNNVTDQNTGLINEVCALEIVQRNETVCRNETLSFGKVYNTPGRYIRNLGEIVNYTFNESGDYRLSVLVPSMNIEVNKDFVVGEPNPEVLQLNQTVANETVVNQTIGNQTVEIKTTRARIKLGQPVKWTKNITLENPGAIEIDIPKEADNIAVSKIEDGQEKQVVAEVVGVTANVIEETRGSGWFYRLINRVVLGVTGRAVDEQGNESAQVILQDNATEYVIEYETPAPTAIETAIEGGKEIVISAPDNLNYTDVLAFTNLDDTISFENENSINIYWVESQTYLSFDAYDENNNGKIDYIEWVVPHLSNQTFWLIYNSTNTVVWQCGNITEAGTYTLNQSIENIAGTCFIIQSDNVVLDGNGYNVSGVDIDDLEDYGVFARGVNNITVRNISIDHFGDYNYNGSRGGGAILFRDVNNSVIQFMTASITSTGIEFWDCYSGVLDHINLVGLDGWSMGIYLFSSSPFEVQNHIVSNINSIDYGNAILIDGSGGTNVSNFYASSAWPIWIEDCSLNNLTNITVNSAEGGIWMYNVTLNSISDVSFVNLSYGGLGMYGETSNNVFNNFNIVNSTRGLYIRDGSSDNVFSNINTTLNSIYGIFVNGSSNGNTFGDINASNNFDGVLIGYSSNNTLTNIVASFNRENGISLDRGSSNNNLTNLIASSNSLIGVGVTSGSNRNNLLNVTVSGNAEGIFIWDSATNNILGDMRVSNNDYGIEISDGSNNNTLFGTEVSSNSQYGVYLSNASDNIFKNLELYGNADSEVYGDSWPITPGNVLTFNNSMGEIRFAPLASNAHGTIRFGVGQNIQIGNNFAYTNSSGGMDGLNVSANITFYGMPGTFTNPVIMRNGADVCNETTIPSCYNFTSLNAGTVVFNVSSWSSYSIQDAPVGQTYIINCTNITSPGTYILQNDINFSTAGNAGCKYACINITSDNVTFDGNGHSLIGANKDCGALYNYAVSTYGVKNIVVKNLATIGANRPISFYYTNDSFIQNNTIQNYDIVGIEFVGYNLSILNNKVTSGCPCGNYPMSPWAFFGYGDLYNSNISNNDLVYKIVNSSLNYINAGGYGIYTYGSYIENNVYENNRVINSTFGFGWNSLDTSNNLIANNFVDSGLVDGVTLFGTAMYLTGQSSRNNRFINNTIINSHAGIPIDGNSSHNIFENNTILNSNYTFGIWSWNCGNSGGYSGVYSPHNTYVGNNITNAVYGIYGNCADNTTFVSNFLNNVTTGIYMTSYFINESGYKWDYTGGIIGSNVSDNYISNGGVAINLSDSLYTDISGNVFSGNYLDFYATPVSNGSYNLSNAKILIEDASFGRIDFTSLVNTTSLVLSRDVVIGNNSAYVSSSVNPGLNTAANITLYGIGNRGFVDPKILKDGGLCVGCYNFTALDASTVKFNVTGWSNYSVGEPGKVTSCMTITVPGEYVLQNNLSSNGDCLTVNSDDVVLNGNGHSLNCTVWHNATGIYINSRTNVTVHGFAAIDSFYTGLAISGGGNNIVYDMNLSTLIPGQQNNGYCISLGGTSSNNISNVNLSYSGAGLNVDHSRDNIFSGIFAGSNYNNVVFWYADNNTFSDSSLYMGNNGINIQWSFDNLLINVNATDNGQMGFYSNFANNNTFSGIRAQGNNKGFFFSHSNNNRVISLYSYDNNRDYHGTTRGDVVSWFNAANNVNNSFIDSRAWTYVVVASDSLKFENTTYGLVEFLPSINATGADLIGGTNSDVIFGNNSVYVNSSISGFNKSANITLYGIGNRGFANPRILKNGAVCADCYNFTALDASTVKFNVSSSGSYGIANVEGSFVSDCMTISSPGTYILLNDLSEADEICFNIQSDNVVLDGGGYTINGTYGGGFNHYGIYMTGRSNVTITNFGGINSYDRGIRIQGACSNINLSGITVSDNYEGIVSDHSITNSTFTNLNVFSNQASGIALNVCNNSLLSDINVSFNGLTSSYSYGLHLRGGINNTLYNIIALNNTWGGIVISSYTSWPSEYPSSNNVLFNITSSNNGYGIMESESFNDSLWDINSTNNQYGLFLFSSSNNSINGSFLSNSVTDILCQGSEYNFKNGIEYVTQSGCNLWILNANGENCTNLSDCQSGYCDTFNGVCSNGSIGDSCGTGSDCQSGVCSSNNVCTDRLVGSPCGNGSDCQTGYCDLNNYTCQLAVLTPGDITTCGIINQSGSYKLKNNFTDMAGTCFDIQVDNVILNGDGYNIGGNGSGYGIYFNGCNDTVISNFSWISNFDRGVFSYLGSNNAILNIINLSSNNQGIVLNLSSNNVISNISSLSNNGLGISMEFCHNNSISDIVTSDDGNSIYVYNCSNNIIRDINNSSGIILQLSSDNRLTSINVLNSISLGEMLSGAIISLDSSNNNFSDINISASDNGNIVLDSGSNNRLSNLNVFGGGAIDIYDFSNSTFSDINVSNGNGIGIGESINNTFINLIASANEDYGISLSDSFNNSFTGEALLNTGFDLFCSNSDDNTNNGLFFGTQSGCGDWAYYVGSNLIGCVVISQPGNYVITQDVVTSERDVCFNITSDNVVLNGNGRTVTGDGTGYGVYVNNVKNVSIENFGEINGFNDGIYFEGTNLSKVEASSLINNKYGLHLYGSHYNNFTLIQTSTNQIYDLYLGGVGSDNNRFVDSTMGTYNLDVPSKIIFVNESYGQIGFLTEISGIGADLFGLGSSDIVVGNDSVYVNSAKSGLNKSANVTLYGLSTNFVDPVIVRDGLYECNPSTIPSCYNFTSLNSGTVIFNVSSWSSYLIMGRASIPVCGDNSCNNGETCSTCSVDCGTCGGGSHGGGSSGGSGGCVDTNWTVVGNFGACINGSQTWSERSNCGKTRTMNASCLGNECIPNWVCTDLSECVDGVSNRHCIDSNVCPNAKPLLDTIPCEENENISQTCRPSISCSDWGDCYYGTKTEDIFNGAISSMGYRSRICSDSNGCVGNYEDYIECKSGVQVELIGSDSCGTKTLSLVSKLTGEPVTDINVDAWAANKLSLKFIQSKSTYCPECYDGVKSNGEEGIDCGGYCSACLPEKSRWNFRYLIWVLWALAYLLSLVLFSMLHESNEKIENIRKLIDSGSKALAQSNISVASANYEKVKVIFAGLGNRDKKVVQNEILNYYNLVRSRMADQ